MHASLAYMNGAAEMPGGRQNDARNLQLLNTLLVGAGAPEPSVDTSRKPWDEKQAEEESQAESATRPGGFHNDPDDPTNPNEVRERHLDKIKP